MRVRRAAYVIATVALSVVSASASSRQKPDFSGTWTSERATLSDSAPRRSATGDMGSGWGPTITIKQDAQQLTVQYEFFTRGDMQPPLRFVYALDGSETNNSVMMGNGIQTQKSKAVWQGDKLVITTLYSFTNPENGRPMTSEVTRTLSLESATTLLVEMVIAGVLGGPPTTTRTLYGRL